MQLLRADLDPEQAQPAILESLAGSASTAGDARRSGRGAAAIISRDQAVSSLLTGWNGFSPRTRNPTCWTELLRRTDLTMALLAAAQRKHLDLQLDARRRQQLLNASDERVRTAAAACSRRRQLDVARGTDRQPIGRPGRIRRDAELGRQTFQRVCATCHQFSGLGHAVGPDLEALSNKSVDFLLTAILDPNRAVESNYLDYLRRDAVMDGNSRESCGVKRPTASRCWRRTPRSNRSCAATSRACTRPGNR